VLHLYRKRRPGQLRDVSWLAPVLLRLRDLGDYETALLMKAKIEACLAAVVTDDTDEALTGAAANLLRDAQGRPVEAFEPGMILYRRGGGSVDVVRRAQLAAKQTSLARPTRFLAAPARTNNARRVSTPRLESWAVTTRKPCSSSAMAEIRSLLCVITPRCGPPAGSPGPKLDANWMDEDVRLLPFAPPPG
jgi:hypothetical protein